MFYHPKEYVIQKHGSSRQPPLEWQIVKQSSLSLLGSLMYLKLFEKLDNNQDYY